MAKLPPPDSIHPTGESCAEPPLAASGPRAIDTFDGAVHLRWDPQAAVTVFGQMAYFIEFLKTSGLFEDWVADAPLNYRSPNAPVPRDVLGTLLLSVLAGHKRYAHINSIRNDGVNPELLGMSKVVSEDSVRRAFSGVEEAACRQWLGRHLRKCYEPLLEEDWILDIDTTVKPLYGHQQGAERGYNPSKPGRPSQVYHSYFVGRLRMALEVEVGPGNQSASAYAQPGLWSFLDTLEPRRQPRLLRGDTQWGSERAMSEAERRGIAYLFKLRQTTGVKRLIERLFRDGDWEELGEGWEGAAAELQLKGWSRRRQVAVLRRRVRGSLAWQGRDPAAPKQLPLGLAEVVGPGEVYEYAVLVSSLEADLETLGRLYRDRADAENNFDELKNQWGWAGFTTQDMKRCEALARVQALVYNWWGLFVRLVNEDKRPEAITSRPLMLHGIARRTRHGRQTTLTITSLHAKAKQMSQALQRASAYLRWVRATAEQLSREQRWRLILSWIFRHFLRGRPLGARGSLAAAPG
jgi:hypothetical protein